jgi:Fe-S-cluster containining protein
MPDFDCLCCGLCCKRDPYYAVSLLDIENISQGLGLSPSEFFNRFCSVVVTPGGFRYPVILASEGCPFLKDKLCGIHSFKPIGCRVFPESSLLPVTLLKKSVRAIESCAILALPDSEEPLATDHELMARRDVHFEHTKTYFEKHEDFDEPSWTVAKEGLKKMLTDADVLTKRSAAIRDKASTAIKQSQGL